MLAASPEPRIVKLKFTPKGEDWFAGNAKLKAIRYLREVKLEA